MSDHDALVKLLKSVDELQQQVLTETVREIKSPAQFLTQLLFPRRRSVHTHKLEIGLKTGGRTVAPFVRRGGEALLVGGLRGSFQTVAPANIRIKKPFEALSLLTDRRPGMPIFTDPSTQLTALQQTVADDLEFMKSQKDNAIEYLVSQTLTGVISYQADPHENYQITIPRPATHTPTLTVFWDDADPDLVNIEGNCHSVKRIMNDDPGFPANNCILGQEAADCFLKVMKAQNKALDKRRLDDGSITFQSQFEAQGAIYLGRYAGIDFWEYSRTLTLPDGTTTPMIRSKYAEFVHVGQAADRILYFGAIPDIDAINAGQHIGEEFSKSWVAPDPSEIMYLLHSCPLPWPRRANTWVSLKVVSG